MANNLIKVIIAGAQVVGRSFARAVRKEFAASQHASQKAGGGEKGNQSAASSSLYGMSIDEAKQILNISDIHDDEKLFKTYDHLMKVNDKSEGGSLYLQSKVFRAKQRIDVERSNLEKLQKENNETPS